MWCIIFSFCDDNIQCFQKYRVYNISLSILAIVSIVPVISDNVYIYPYKKILKVVSSDKKRNGDENNQDTLCISVSFGGLLLDISNLKREDSSGKPKAFEDIEIDEELFLLMKKIKK